MSHFNTLRTKLTDIGILKSSLHSLGMVVHTDTEVRGSDCQRI